MCIEFPGMSSRRFPVTVNGVNSNDFFCRVDQEAREQVKIMLKQMAEKQGVTEQMKMQDQMKWVGLMNSIKACAEEIVLKERVYM